MVIDTKLSTVRDGIEKRVKESCLELFDETWMDVGERSPFRTLVDLNREKRVRKHREKILEHIKPHPLLRKSTLIIGTRCKEGLVIGSDKKTLRGGETEYSCKVFQFDIGAPILFAAEGLTGIRDDFFLLLRHEIYRRRGVDTLYEVKMIVEDIISELTERYRERVRDPRPIGVLMGGLERLSEGEATLYYIHSEGYGERITFRCTGHGAQYAYSLAKFLCGPRIAPTSTVEDVAKRIAFAISWVAEDVDSTVGGAPDVFIMRDQSAEVEKLADEDVVREVQHAQEAKEKFCDLLFLQESNSMAADSPSTDDDKTETK